MEITHTLEADGIQLYRNDRRILGNVYLKCETGKITGLLGRNAAGKSTLMNTIYGEISAEKSIRFDGRSIVEPFKHPKLIRYLPQFNFVPRSMSLSRLFADFELDLQSFFGAFSNFSPKASASMSSLSSGERRLVEIFVIAKSSSRFVMLDEPFTNLAPIRVEEVKQLLNTEKRQKGILITDHLYNDVVDISDDLYMLSNGGASHIKDPGEFEAYGYVPRQNG